MAISKVQPMREAEIELVDVVNGYSNRITALEQGLEDTNTVVGQLSEEIGTEIARAKSAETALGNKVNTTAELQDEKIAAIESDVDELQDDFASVPVFGFGELTFEDMEAGASVIQSVEFADEKESTPRVFLTVEDIETDEHTADCNAIVTALSVSGFTVRAINDSADTATVTVAYLVIGE